MMTIAQYEKDGGFKSELLHLREIGTHMVSLAEAIPTRPNRPEELKAYSAAMDALEILHAEVIKTRNSDRKHV